MSVHNSPFNVEELRKRNSLMSENTKKIRAAVLRELPGPWTVEDLEISSPKRGEVLVELKAAGLCHSDDHHRQNDLPLANLPAIVGHEGAGVVIAVGEGVYDLEIGDHVVASFIPACGKCKWCSLGMQNLCDYGRFILEGTQIDGTFRITDKDGKGVATAAMLGTFSNYQIMDQTSLIKVDKDIPFPIAAIVACGVPTGVGSARNVANVQPGDVVVIMGIGGIGMNAVQGATLAGARHIIAVDPIEYKRKRALEFGATDVFATIQEAEAFAKSITNGQGADSAIVTVGVITGEHVSQAYQAVRKGGTLVVTALGKVDASISDINLFDLAMMQKRIQGNVYGGWSPRVAVPMLLDLYRDGKLKLDELITRTYKIDEINEAFDDMHSGKNIRGVIIHEH
jgi:S-(hydroxymethyl)glutathione dehydrogenase/alcohol dehydrogenase